MPQAASRDIPRPPRSVDGDLDFSQFTAILDRIDPICMAAEVV